MKKSNVVALNLSEVGEELPLLPEGEYVVGYVKHVTFEQFRSKKVVFYFQIIDHGKWHGAILERFYNVERFTSKRGKNGSFIPPPRGNFMLDYAMCFGMPLRRDRISLTRFEGKLFRVKVRTVKQNHEQRKYPESMQHSVIDSILGIEEI